MNIRGINVDVPVITRYIITIAFAALSAIGWVDQDALPEALQNQIVLLVSTALTVIPAVYAIIRRPSAKALQVAKVIDQHAPAGKAITIQTPAGEPDIVVN